ncbi:helix-turn-helix domain-containing protein [Blastococcus brunescens]|uniref:Helix-turn-helix domain-containing protein n=1 Tax=Blastococcus brunescens TaxID=1564165 RepID=A0ABZ1B0B3_9ACTN|nr:helix-turn-helix domain-containing protein [Blastococcus sp. BMG 8361]WRL64256.1 helix-turn-helix domain-containing protein [Blastococcus sp. BMG 8361]
MSEILDRRAQKKARTRVHVRTVAQRMFAEGGFDAVTIADIARGADVAVQTIFNHFATKEELFFDGRIPWVDGPADAVRRRPPGTSPLTALRRHLVEGQATLSRSTCPPRAGHSPPRSPPARPWPVTSSG